MLKKTLRYLSSLWKANTYRKILDAAGVKHAERIHTWTKIEELQTLCEHALNARRGCEALEIGSYLGASTCYIASGLMPGGGHLTCVDTWNNETIPGGERDTYAEFLRYVEPLKDYLTLIRKNSYDLTKDDFKEHFHFVFIDGDHSYEAVRHDFKLVEQVTVAEAEVFFHDARAFPGVARVIGEALATGRWRIGGLVSNLFWIVKV